MYSRPIIERAAHRNEAHGAAKGGNMQVQIRLNSSMCIHYEKFIEMAQLERNSSQFAFYKNLMKSFCFKSV